MTKYNVTDRGKVVAVIANMLFESGNWTYNTNHYPAPGSPGQGTRSMMMWDFVQNYATFLYADKAESLLKGSTGVVDDDTQNAVRDLVLNDNDSFGSGFWFLTEQAPTYNQADKLKAGSLEDFKDYIENGINTDWDVARGDRWSLVNTAFNS
ncbi:hypothetical protein LPJ57_004935 [Coemansia sp. RSA 486]|nr:hypothetical protein LPJ57_004935 [Coemansia sp. RSA 486]KAJ2227458.1 hypothetical protein IWW45_007033 [Coemansia sp. RSA 485]